VHRYTLGTGLSLLCNSLTRYRDETKSCVKEIDLDLLLFELNQFKQTRQAKF
jgi:hypothetical protein